jgi:hypothetical protein
MNLELTTQTKFKSLEINNNFYNRLSILFIGICNVFKKWFKLGKKVKPIETPIPTNMVTPTPTVIPLPTYREILLSNPNGESTAKNCCKITTGLPKYIDYTVEISAGLVIYNDIALTERTYITNPYGNKYAMIYDPIGTNGVNGGKRFSVKFDNDGTVNNHIDCVTKIPKPTSTPQIAYEYEAIRCGDELKTKIIANNPNLKQNVYSLSQENINTCYRIVSESTEVNAIGNTYYLIGNCNDKRCAQL